MKRYALVFLLLCGSALGQMINQDLIPASSGLNIGHSNQQWNGYFNNLTVAGTGTFSGTQTFNILNATSGTITGAWSVGSLGVSTTSSLGTASAGTLSLTGALFLNGVGNVQFTNPAAGEALISQTTVGNIGSGDALYEATASNGTKQSCIALKAVISNGTAGETQIANCSNSPSTIELTGTNGIFASFNAGAPLNAMQLNSVGQLVISGGVTTGGTSNTDQAGSLTFSASTTSNSYTFTGTYSVAPICTITSLADPVGRIWISTLNTTTLQLTDSSSASITVDYVCFPRH